MNRLRSLSLHAPHLPAATVAGIAVLVTLLTTNKMTEAKHHKQKTAVTAKISKRATIVFAIHDIPQGLRIDRKALAERQISVSGLPPTVVHSAAAAVGHVCKHGLSVGQLVTAEEIF